MSDRIFVFRVHAIQRMAEREVSPGEVARILAEGKTIEDYPHDFPYPSSLTLGWLGERPLHVVAARDEREGLTIVITVYEPDPAEWSPGFEKRRAT